MQLAAEEARRVSWLGSKGIRLNSNLNGAKCDRSQQNKQSSGALLSMSVQTGEIMALVGGRSFVESKFNRALYGKRQPGSAFKAIVYAAALSAGMTPATVVEDEPLEFQTQEGIYRPTNSDQTFRGGRCAQR
jgi:penicillin-binding protein 1A